MASCNFQVGQKVVCVKPSPLEQRVLRMLASMGCMMPSIGQTLTIRDVYVGSFKGQPEVFLKFHEIVNPPVHCRDVFREGGFIANRFRPVVERKTDISIFQAMLNKTPEQVPA